MGVGVEVVSIMAGPDDGVVEFCIADDSARAYENHWESLSKYPLYWICDKPIRSSVGLGMSSTDLLIRPAASATSKKLENWIDEDARNKVAIKTLSASVPDRCQLTLMGRFSQKSRLNLDWGQMCLAELKFGCKKCIFLWSNSGLFCKIWVSRHAAILNHRSHCDQRFKN